MSTVTATTAPDFRVIADVPRLDAAPGAVLQLLVLAADGGQCAGVDVASGAMVRAWSATRVPALAPYDLVDVVVADDDDAVPDPCQPEAIAAATAPEPAGRMGRRQVERLLRPLLHPADAPLLGLHGPAVPFWERRPDSPSIAVVDPKGPVLLRRDGGYLACRFVWQGVERELACLDRRQAAQLDRVGMTRAEAPRGTRLVVALTPPIDGHCHKVVEAVLPRP